MLTCSPTLPSHPFPFRPTDFEYGDGHYDRTRELYERLLKRTEHVKVWISYAEMEAAILDNSDASSLDRVRKIYERAEQSLKSRNQSEEVRIGKRVGAGAGMGTDRKTGGCGYGCGCGCGCGCG